MNPPCKLPSYRSLVSSIDAAGRTRSRLSKILLSCSVATLLGQIQAHAANYYWNTTTSGTWTSAGNWNSAADGGGVTGAPTTSGTAVFNETAVNGNETVLLSAGATIGAIIFNNTGATTLESSSSTAQTLTLSSGTTIAINAGAGTVTIGDATNVLNVAFTQSTQTVALNGATSLALSNTTSFNGSGSNVSLTLNGVGNTVTFNAVSLNPTSKSGRGVTFNGSANAIINGAVTDGGSAAANFIYAGSGTLALYGNNTFTGNFSLTSGQVNIGNANALGSGTLILGTSGTIDNITGSSLTLATNNAMTANSSTLTFVGSNSLTFGTGTLAITNSATFNVLANTLTMQGGISGAFGFTKNGAGTLVLSGTNTNSAFTAKAGTLQFAKEVSLLNNNTSSWTASNITVSSGATLAFNVGGSGEFSNGDVTTLLTNLTGANNGLRAGSSIGFDTTNATSGTFTISDVIKDSAATGGGGAVGVSKLGTGTLKLTGVNTYTGATKVLGGTLEIDGSLAAGSAVTVTDAALSGSGTVAGTVTGTNTTINGSGLTLGATTLYGTSTLSGTNIASSVTVADGITTLTGTTRSTSALTVSVGATLFANGTIDGSAAVSGLLKGNSTVTGNLALTSGTLAPGNSPGTTTVTGNFTMDANSKLVAEVTGATAGSTYDQVKVSGNVSLAGTLDLSTLSGLTLGNMITLIDNAGTGTTTGYFTTLITSGSTYTLTSNSDYTFTANGTEYLLSYNTTNTTSSYYEDVTLTVVPEPSTWAIAVGGGAMLLLLQRRRRIA